MSYRVITAGMFTLMAFGANAQGIDKRPLMEPAHSPFTYEALGATPSLQLGKRTAPDGDAKRATARERKNRSTLEASHRDEPATVEKSLRSQPETKQ